MDKSAINTLHRSLTTAQRQILLICEEFSYTNFISNKIVTVAKIKFGYRFKFFF